MIELLFPSGWSHFLGGGLLIGLGVSLMFICTGRIVGLSSFFSSTFSWVSKLPYFSEPRLIDSRRWRILVCVGLLFGSFIWLITLGQSIQQSTNLSEYRLLLGGILVGFGARLSNGCTSGHGICGLSSLSLPSLWAVITFMVMAMITSQVLYYL